MGKTLYRSRTDRMLAGVAGGIADYVGQDPTLIRLAIVLLTLVSSGAIVVAYLVMWAVVPEEPLGETAEQSGGEKGAQPTEPNVVGQDATKAASATPPPPASATAPPPAPPAEPAAAPPIAHPVTPPAAPPVVGVGPPASSVPGTDPGASPSTSRGGWWFGIALVAVGAFMLAARFVPRLDLVELWPVGIIIIGIFMVFSRKDG